jgi:hypothetical protein
MRKGDSAKIRIYVHNKLCIWLVRFGRTALLQIAYVAGSHCAICAWHGIFNSDGQMHNLLLTIS